MAYNNSHDETVSFDNSADLFDDSFDEEDYFTALNISGANCRDEVNENEQSKHLGADVSTVRNDDVDITESFICPFCESNEDSVYSLESHIAAVHPDMIVDENTKRPNHRRKSLRFGHKDDPHNFRGEDDDDFLLVCPYCDMRLESDLDFSEHIDSMHKEEFLGPPSTSSMECPVCNEPFSSETGDLFIYFIHYVCVILFHFFYSRDTVELTTSLNLLKL